MLLFSHINPTNIWLESKHNQLSSEIWLSYLRELYHNLLKLTICNVCVAHKIWLVHIIRTWLALTAVSYICSINKDNLYQVFIHGFSKYQNWKKKNNKTATLMDQKSNITLKNLINHSNSVTESVIFCNTCVWGE